MKKSTLLFCASLIVALAFPSSVKAQGITSDLYEYNKVTDTEGEEWDNAGGSLRVSDNGLYAVGSCPNNYPYAAFFVDIESKEITFLNTLSGEKQDRLIVADVANDGLMCGSYIATVTSSDGSESLVWHPGVRYLDGDWIDLPLPEQAITSYLNYDISDPDLYTHYVKRISPDGKVLLGQVWMEDTVEVNGVKKYGSYYEPVLWYFDPATKQCTGVKDFRSLPFTGQGFIPYDMSDDGSVIVGMSESAIGDQCPAYIKDGEIVFLETASDWGVWWAGGMATCIDDAGTIYYRFPDDTSNSIIHSGRYNVYTDERLYYDDDMGHVICGTPGLVVGMASTTYGPCSVFEGDTSLPVSALTRPENISDDGKVIAGAGLTELSVSTPAFLVFSEAPCPTTIEQVKIGDVSLSKNGNIVTVNGDFDKVELLNVAGQNFGSTGGTIDMSNLTNGLYIVKVSKGNQTFNYKVLK